MCRDPFRAEALPAHPLNQSSTTGFGVPRLETDWADALSAEYSRLVAKNLAASKGESQESATPQTVDAADQKRFNAIQEIADKADARYKGAGGEPDLDRRLSRPRTAVTGQERRGADGCENGNRQPKFTSSLHRGNPAVHDEDPIDPKSREAYRRRGEAYRSLANHPQLKKRYSDRARYLSQAAQSADSASQLGKDRDPACLELLAKVIESEAEMYDQLNAPKNALNFYKQASYYWQEAASCPNADRGRMQDMLSQCRQRARQRQVLVAEASRGVDEAVPEPEFPLWVPGSNLFRDKDKE